MGGAPGAGPASAALYRISGYQLSGAELSRGTGRTRNGDRARTSGAAADPDGAQEQDGSS